MLHAGAAEKLSPDDCREQIERLIASPLLQGSESHCKLIRYLGEQSLNLPTGQLKEYLVATEGLGRSPDFDPHSDSSVRVQVGRLRNKLTEYYNTLGADDPIIVEIPKGKYKVTFKKNSAQSEEQPSDSKPSFWQNRNIHFAALGLMIAFLFVLLVIDTAIPIIRAKKQTSAASVRSLSPLEIFWTPFFHASEEPFVVFANSEFVGNSTTGLRRFDPVRDKKDATIQRYTGIGEVMGVLELNQLFGKYGRSFHAKRAGLFTLDDAQNFCVIFVGFPGEILSQVPSTHEFTFIRLRDSASHNRLAILSNSANKAKKSVSVVSSDGQPDGVDYAIVALEKGQDHLHWKLFLEGTSTVATQAAVNFVCNDESVKMLEKQLHVTQETGPKPFEALLKVKVAKDVPMDTAMVDLREIKK
jgi:hypothetical protein